MLTTLARDVEARSMSVVVLRVGAMLLYCDRADVDGYELGREGVAVAEHSLRLLKEDAKQAAAPLASCPAPPRA